MDSEAPNHSSRTAASRAMDNLASMEARFPPAITEVKMEVVEASPLDVDMQNAEESTHLVRKSDDILKKLAMFLRTFAVALLFALAVRLFALGTLFYQEKQFSSSMTTKSFADTAVSTGGASGTLMDIVVAILCFCTAHHILKAAEPTHAHEKRARHMHLVVLYLCSLFNSYGVGMVLKAVVSGVVAAVAYPQILTVVSVAVLLGSLFWISGFLFITLSNRRWGRSSEALVMLLSAPQDQLDEVPVYLRFWMTQVFGRLSPKRRGTADAKRKDPFKLDLLENQDITFTPEQMHILKILYEAMMYAVKNIALSVSSCCSILCLSWSHHTSLQQGTVSLPLGKALASPSPAGPHTLPIDGPAHPFSYTVTLPPSPGRTWG
mmetsp:Transcript_19087/g.53188  ORF Transcript_19087/g.53188 Transcript_19087/m.53188 type:complete len:378 (-) Transcript_19087:566-1699(-)